MAKTKSVLVLGRRDPGEAMRVAAGLTIFDHRPSVIFTVAVPDTPDNTEMAELLEFSDIEARTTSADVASLPQIGSEELAAAILDADSVISL